MKYNSTFFISFFTIIILINIIFSIYFVPVFLAGVVFMIFLEALNKEYYYILLMSIFTFLIIENTHGLAMFSFSLISLFIYFFIIPRIKHLFSASLLGTFSTLGCFYAIFFLLFILSNNSNFNTYIVFTLNFILDILVVGFII